MLRSKYEVTMPTHLARICPDPPDLKEEKRRWQLRIAAVCRNVAFEALAVDVGCEMRNALLLSARKWICTVVVGRRLER